jgi:hypothetical protein
MSRRRIPFAGIAAVAILIGIFWGPIADLDAAAVLVVISTGILIHLLVRDRGMAWRPGDGNPEDAPGPLDDMLTEPVRPTNHVVARTPDEGYEVT